MKQIFIVLISLILVIASCSETKNATAAKTIIFDIWTEQTNVQQAIDFEKSLSNEYEIFEQNVSLSKSIYPLLDKYQIAQPFIVKRKQTGFLPIYAEYFFSKSDSTLRYVSYDMERDKYGNFFKKKEIWKEESRKIKAYNQEYENVKSELLRKLGTPIKEDSKPQITKSSSNRGDYLSRNTTWETDDFHATLNMIFESMTYRIRLSYYWKK